MKKIVLLVVLIAVCSYWFFGTSSEEYIYITEKIENGKIVETVTASGMIDPISTVNVGTQISGAIQEIYVDYNSPVKQNQLLAIIDPAMFLARVRQQKANLNSAKAQLKVVESQLIYEKKNLVRIKKLNEKEYSSQKEVDIAQKDHDVLKAQISLSKAQIEQIEASLSLAETELGYTKIISPVDGIIVSKDVEVGQTVAASFQTPTLFQVAEDLSKMQIIASVVETDVTKVSEGQKVIFTVDGFHDEKFEGKVIQVRNNPTTIQNVVSYEVIIEIYNNDLKFKPGMTANVEIITSEKENIMVSPNKALRFYVLDETGENSRYQDRGLWVLNEENKPIRIAINVGISDDEKTEIISNDQAISAGTEVIVERKTAKAVKEEQKQRKMHMRVR